MLLVANSCLHGPKTVAFLIVTRDSLSKLCLGNLSTGCAIGAQKFKRAAEGLIIRSGSVPGGGAGSHTQVLFLQQSTPVQ